MQFSAHFSVDPGAASERVLGPSQWPRACAAQQSTVLSLGVNMQLTPDGPSHRPQVLRRLVAGRGPCGAADGPLPQGVAGAERGGLQVRPTAA